MNAEDDPNGLQSYLSELRLVAGQPSLRTMAKNLPWSHATIGRSFTGGAVPRWDIVESITVYLHGDTEEAHRLWVAHMRSYPDGKESALEADPPPSFASAEILAPFMIILFVFLLLMMLQGVAPGLRVWTQSINDASQMVCGSIAAYKWGTSYLDDRDPRRLSLAIGMAGWSFGYLFLFVCRDVLGIENLPSPTASDVGFMLLPACVASSFLPAAKRTPAIVVTVVGTAFLALLLHVPTRVPFGFVTVHSFYLITDLILFLLFFSAWRNERLLAWGLSSLAALLLLPSDVLLLVYGSLHTNTHIPYGVYIGYVGFSLTMSVAASFHRGMDRRPAGK